VPKNYQNQEIETSHPAVPERVSVALGELAGELREGLLALAVKGQLDFPVGGQLISLLADSLCPCPRSADLLLI
jgi:hypothetical protein